MTATSDLYMDQVLNISERLIALMLHETQKLKNREHFALSDIQQEKARLGYIYETHMKKLQDEPELVKNLSASVQARFREVAQAFDEAAKENLITLKAAHMTGTRVLKALRHSIIEDTSRLAGYSNRGLNNPSAYTTQTSVSLNQKL